MPPTEPRARPGAPVLVVGAGPFQLALIHAVQQRGLRAVVVDRNPNAPGMQAADVAVPCDIIDVPAVVQVARAHQVVAVASSASDAAMPAVAGVAEALELPGQRPAVIHTCRDKLLTYQAVAAAGLPAPTSVPVGGPAEAMAAVDLVGSYPVVVKPRSAAGGRGVSIVRSFSELGPAFARADAASRGSGVMVQAFVGGESVGVEAVFWEGRLLDAFVLVDTYREGFVSPVGHALPCPWPQARQAAVIAAAAEFARACGLTHGSANFDLRDAGGRTTLIEINPRPGGSNIADLVGLCYGVDLSQVTVSLALGEHPGPVLARHGAQPTASRLLLVRGRGPLRVPADPGRPFEADPRVNRLRLGVRDGEPAPMAVDDWSLLGDCVTVADTVEAALHHAEQVALHIEASVHADPVRPAR